MAKETRPAMLFYGKDWYDDINVQEMDYAEQGMYLRLCWWCWTEGSIPSEGERVAKLLKVDPATFIQNSWTKLKGCFTQSDDRLIHGKVEEIRAETLEFSRRMSERGRAGAEARWRDDGTSISQASPKQCETDAKRWPSSASSSASASSTTEENNCAFDNARDSNSPKTSRKKPARNGLTEQQLAWFDAWWAEYPRKKDKGHAMKAFKAHVQTQEQLDVVMDGLKKQLPELLSRAPEYIPYPATWLNGLHWLDDVTPAKTDAFSEALRMINEEKSNNEQ